ncbi:MAG: EamA family transporter RarD [Actinobacteria bacterium]|nr:EamA family transporter RarD [Actinomycetota bacterium]NCW83395.1 EamA family transporter RarD [Acidimicrobiia bacterium]NDC99637.1 EamA family transporter RarD [bacterium]NDA37326.1 EamA family transporter RarD [Acidimicrobiia bacterium]NDA96602.1 EamA family transporter RarD [Actinomycetota bacterium]
MPKSSERSGIAYAFGAYITWGFLTIYWKFLKDFNAFELIGWRIVTSAVVLLAILLYNKQLRNLAAALRDKRVRKIIGVASIMLAINWTTYVWAVVHDHVLETALGYFIAPIFTMLIGFIVLREPVRNSHRIIIFLASIAIAILTYSYGQPPWRALLIASSWSVYGFLKKKIKLSSLESLSGEVVALTLPAIGLVVVTFDRTDSVVNMASGIEWLLVLFTGLMTAIPLLMFGAASRRVRLSVLGPMQYLVPTFNFLLGWLVYNEELNAFRVLGFAFVWVGLVIFFIDSLKSTKTNN